MKGLQPNPKQLDKGSIYLYDRSQETTQYKHQSKIAGYLLYELGWSGFLLCELVSCDQSPSCPPKASNTRESAARAPRASCIRRCSSSKSTGASGSSCAPTTRSSAAEIAANRIMARKRDWNERSEMRGSRPNKKTKQTLFSEAALFRGTRPDKNWEVIFVHEKIAAYTLEASVNRECLPLTPNTHFF